MSGYNNQSGSYGDDEFEHQDGTIAPRLVQQQQRDDRGLAGAGWCVQDHPPPLGERGAHRLDRLADRQVADR